MTPIERLSLTAAFMAAAVAVGLSLSLVPNVELITLVVFASGILLGAGRGAWIGASGMTLYVFANSTLGFPPSPLPILAAQAAGMALVGAGGGLWKRVWLGRGRPRREALDLLPAVGALLSGTYQVLLNLTYAAYYLPEEGFWTGFWLGMLFGSVQIGCNAVVFAVAGPAVAATLRRLSRDRGWWRAAAVLAALLLAAAGSAALPASARAEEAAPDSGAGEAWAEGVHPRSLALVRALPPTESTLLGRPAWSSGVPLDARTAALATHPSIAAAWDRFALGWGRSRFSYDGVPTDGPVHVFAEPPDLPASWRGGATERFTASGTRIDRLAPPRRIVRPLSEVSLTTGTYGRRTTEFSLHRNLSRVNLAVDFADREFGPSFDASDVDGTRIWVRLESVPDDRPDWSVDVSDGTREHELFNGSRLARNSRRIQAALRGPTLGGPTRIALQARRQAVKSDAGPVAQEELLWDGFTLQGNWGPPAARGLDLEVRWDRDRRRGVLDEARTLDGVRAAATLSRGWGPWSAGVEASAGHQEPWGGTWEAAAAVAYEGGGVRAAASVSREEGIPALATVVDRSAPEFGLSEYLETVETLEDPERTRAVRVEAGWTGGRASVTAGAWAARQENYLYESNPLWAAPLGSPYTPVPPPAREADILGVYGGGRIALGGGFAGTGRGHVHDRNLGDVPYLPRFTISGDLHFRRLWFGGLDLDVAVGGDVFGVRRNPAGEEYPAASIGHLRLIGRMGGGIVVFAVENLADTAAESSFRSEDTVTPLAVAGRQFVIGLTMRLFD